MNFIDSHCHLNYKDFDGELDDILQRAKDVNIKAFLNICTELDEAKTIIATADKYPHIFASVGVHPHDAEPGLTVMNRSELTLWLVEYAKHPKVVALGETGLDYFYDNSPRDQQRESFRAHLDAAKETGLPLIIHTRAANEDTVEILKEYAGQVTGVIHCFSETQWLADECLKLGFYISISGIATFKKSGDLRDIIMTVPLDRLLVETDAPFLAPTPHRGKRNEPSFMIETAKIMADLKGVGLGELAKITTDNFQSLFKKARVKAFLDE